MSGYINDLSPTQQEALTQMLGKLDSLPENQKTEFDEAFAKKFTKEATVLRFLRARDFDVDVSFKMLADCLEWRVNFQGIGVRNIKPESIQKELDSGKIFPHGKDKEGRPVFYVLVRLHDNHEEIEETQRFLAYTMERGMELLQPPNEKCTCVFDLSDLHMRNLDTKATKFFTEMLEKCYPESLGWALIMSSPLIFQGFWKVVHAWLPAQTAEKVKFVKEESIKEYIDESELLVAYGGKNTYTHSATTHS
eukprot:TRINITY_DN12217_c0_g1_i1.p1 TRINITY_DN12217_c0_g1~~TRINITY_DN12217_c0_g1_i1.p1  ORF type:complete len:259 (-),score=43.14 TRINITY_DN12217_c0_g1_i1:112-861(-)